MSWLTKKVEGTFDFSLDTGPRTRYSRGMEKPAFTQTHYDLLVSMVPLDHAQQHRALGLMLATGWPVTDVEVAQLGISHKVISNFVVSGKAALVAHSPEPGA